MCLPIGSTEEDFLGLFLLTFLYYFSSTNNTSGHPDITILHGIQLIQEQPHNYDGRYLNFFYSLVSHRSVKVFFRLIPLL